MEKSIEYTKTVNDISNGLNTYLICNTAFYLDDPKLAHIDRESKIHIYCSRDSRLIIDPKFIGMITGLLMKRAMVFIHFPYKDTDLYNMLVKYLGDIIDHAESLYCGHIELNPEMLDMKHTYYYYTIYLEPENSRKQIRVLRNIRWAKVDGTTAINVIDTGYLDENMKESVPLLDVIVDVP